MRGAGDALNLDVAVIGGGVAGTAVARGLRRAHPDWSVAIFERTRRIGGRLHSRHIDGLDHPIELGGMRFHTSHPRVTTLVESLGIATHPFDPAPGRPERSYFRGVFGAGDDDPAAGRGYALPTDQVGRSAADLGESAFEAVVPGYRSLDHEGYARWRAEGRFRGRPVTDWAIGDALEAILGSEGRRFVNDAFGYDTGLRPFCAPDLVEFLFDGGDPWAVARTPDDGMDRIPRELAARFVADGGAVHLDRELLALEVDDGKVTLHLHGAEPVRAARVVLAMPLPALEHVASRSEALRGPAFARLFASVEAFPAMKLYLWYDQPWWRPLVRGIRTTTDLPMRKAFYFDGSPGERSTLLGMYTDGIDVEPWARLYEGAPAGAPAPPAMLAELRRQLAEVHPGIDPLPEPVGSALMYWGADPHEVGWHFWRAGVNSDELLDLAPQPDPALPIYVASEAFSRRQSWVEGALEAADAALARLA